MQEVRRQGVAREGGPVDKQHPASAAREQHGGRRACAAGADHDHVEGAAHDARTPASSARSRTSTNSVGRSSGGSSPAASMTWSGQPCLAAAPSATATGWRRPDDPRSSSWEPRWPPRSQWAGAAPRTVRGRSRSRPAPPVAGQLDGVLGVRRPVRAELPSGGVEVEGAQVHEPFVGRGRRVGQEALQGEPETGFGENGTKPVVSTITSWSTPLGCAAV